MQNTEVKLKRYGKCPVCGINVLLPPKVSIKCCSEECSNISGKRRIDKYKKNNREKIRINDKKYRNSDIRKEWLKETEEDRKVKNREWRKNNKDILLFKQRERYKNNFNIRLRFVIRGYLQRMITRKQKKTTDYINYSFESLKIHIETLFTPGMSWGNYGEWHIDHIRPLCTYKFINDDGSENIEEIKKAMSLTNLQPLWAIDNIKKSGKYPLVSGG